MLQASLGQNHNPISASGGVYIYVSQVWFAADIHCIPRMENKIIVKAGSIFLGFFINVNEEINVKYICRFAC